MVRSIRNLGRPGVSQAAVAAVDAALWDLKARLLGVPLAVLLGLVRGGFEEPVTSDDLDGLRLLRHRAPAGMDVAAGEYGYDLVYFRRMLDAGAVDVLQADASRCGVTERRRARRGRWLPAAGVAAVALAAVGLLGRIARARGPAAARGGAGAARNRDCSAGYMDPSSAIRFDTERVARPLSERGHVSAGAGSAAPARPAEQIERSKERLARDPVAAKARWGGTKGEAEHTARRAGIAAAAVVAMAAFAAVAIRSRRKRRRIWW
ncbi:enolase C-terminal domain-like protein [Sorangium sp. So ce307]